MKRIERIVVPGNTKEIPPGIYQIALGVDGFKIVSFKPARKAARRTKGQGIASDDHRR
jgi:hypothetical protein